MPKSTKRGSRIYPQRGKGGGGAPGDRTMAGSQNPNGLAKHTGQYGAGYAPMQVPRMTPGLVPKAYKNPQLTLPNAGAPYRYTANPRTGRQRPSKRPAFGRPWGV
jgi:hypothetical protein